VKPLEGIRVLDLSRMVAGGVAGMLLADFGADVVKVEQPGVGDPLRQWTAEGRPLWWKVYARNKRFITLNLKSDEGRALLLRLLPKFDVVMESFVPGTLERLQLGPETLHGRHPGLVVLRISGWGQTGPGAARPGFGTLVEAASGFAAMNGSRRRRSCRVFRWPMRRPPRSINAIMFALYHRDVHHGPGQVIDLSLFESLFSLLGPLSAEYAASGRSRSRNGSRSKNSGPRGCYRTRDDGWIAVSGSTPKMAERFLRAYGLEAMLDDPRFASNEARVIHGRELDAAIGKAIGAHTLRQNLAIIDEHRLTAGPVQTVADIEQDPHWCARPLTVDIPDNGRPVRMHDVVPRLSVTPGEIRWTGGALGQDNQAVFHELGVSCDEQKQFVSAGVI
jgi:formyl-CoA transferase